MKAFIIAAAVAVLAFAGSAVAATRQPQSLGDVKVSSATFVGSVGLWHRTVAQLRALTPQTTGQMVWCSDCWNGGSTGTVCVSSGSTANYQWILSTGTQCK